VTGPVVAHGGAKMAKHAGMCPGDLDADAGSEVPRVAASGSRPRSAHQARW